MKFNAGDETDSALTTTMVHELVLCRDAFQQFTLFAGQNILGRRDKLVKVKCYDAYARFLSHLYEFYVGCFKRDLHSTQNLSSVTRDKLFTGAAKRSVERRRDAIESGTAPAWENHISNYQVEVPSEFGFQFRSIRNRTAHVSIERSRPGADISLADFFRQSHRFVFLLYSDALAFWSVKDFERFDWKAIEEFDLTVTPSKIPPPVKT